MRQKGGIGMNAEKRKKVEENITEINAAVIAQLADEAKNEYDPEVSLPQNIKQTAITIKKSYDLSNREKDEENRKRRANRPSTLETYILKGKQQEAEDYVRKQHYTTITSIAQDGKNYIDERTKRKIVKELFTMIGYKAEKIPIAITDELAEIVEKWIPNTKTIYEYNRKKIKPLDMKQEEMTYVYEMYILTKKIILINSANKEEYDQSIAKLNQELTPIYAAIRTLNSING